MFTFLPGESLPNSARVIEATEVACNRFIVLAVSHDDYVTWESDHNGITYWGHYNSNVTAAVADYNARIAGA